MRVIQYPPAPEPHTIEVEATNVCNAECTFCPHAHSKRPHGFLDVHQFSSFLEKIAAKRKQMWLNSEIPSPLFPRIVFGGLGEALLHPRIDRLISACRDLKFPVQVITNGLALTPEKQRMLVDLRVESIAVSLHTINADIYQCITHLPFHDVFSRVRQFLELCKRRDSHPEIELWRIKSIPGDPWESAEDQAAYAAFVANYPFVKVFGPSEPWERDGVVPGSLCAPIQDDPASGIWCHKLFFTLNIVWSGDEVICCNDYNRLSIPMGNVFSPDWTMEKSTSLRQRLLASAPRPSICLHCRRWADTQYRTIWENTLKQRLQVQKKG